MRPETILVSSEEFPEEGKGALDIVSKESASRALAYPHVAHGLLIINEETLIRANDFRNDIRALKKQIDDTFDPHIEKAHDAHKSLIAEKKKFTDPLEAADRIVKPKISEYLAEQDRKRFEAERARQRAEEEAKRIADEGADKAYELASNGNLDEADKLAGQAAKRAETVLSAAPVIPEKLRAEGFRERTQWWAEVVDATLIPRKWLIPDKWEGSTQQKKLDEMARAMKDQFDIPGVVARSRKV